MHNESCLAWNDQPDGSANCYANLRQGGEQQDGGRSGKGCVQSSTRFPFMTQLESACAEQHALQPCAKEINENEVICDETWFLTIQEDFGVERDQELE